MTRRFRKKSKTLVNALPTEILAEIFLASPHPRLSPRSSASFRSRCQNWTRLRLVSRHWDAVISATPQLWSKLYIHLDPKFSNPSISAIELWLRYSMPLPLDLELSIEQRDPMLKELDTQISNIIRTLWKSGDRLRMIGLSSESGGKFSLANRPMSAFSALNFISLFFVDIKPCYHPFHKEMDETMRILATAPALRGMRLEPFMPSTARAMIRELVLSRLTRLELSMCQAQLNVACSVMRECYSLSSVYLKLCCHRDRLIPDPAPLLLPNLQIFSVTSESPTPNVLLSLFKAPKLELVSLDCPISSSGMEILSQYITSAPPSLHVVCVSELEDQLLPFFHKTPKLAGMLIVRVRALSSQREILEVKNLVNEWLGFTGMRNFTTTVTWGGRYCVGWRDPTVYARFDEYFSHPWVDTIPHYDEF